MVLRGIQRVRPPAIDGDLGSDARDRGAREEIRRERARDGMWGLGHLQLT